MDVWVAAVAQAADINIERKAAKNGAAG